jgi:DUF4097 and DUF4098 domain-containing protein YvlB
MTRDSFLDELQKSLGNMICSQKEEIKQDFLEHFRLARQEGKADDEILASLGDPKIIARQFLQDSADVSSPDEPQAANRQGRQNPPPPLDYEPQDGFINLEKEFDASDISIIRLDLKRCNLFLDPNPQSEKIWISIQGYSRSNTFRIDCGNGSLLVAEEDRFSFLRMIRHKIEVDATIRLPYGWRGKIDTLMKMGSVASRGVKAGKLSLHCSYGDIHANDCSFEKAEISSSAGKAELRGFDCPDLRLKLSAGNISLANSKGKINAHSSAGDVEITSHEGEAIANSSAGNVTVYTSKGDVSARTSAGNVRVQCGTGKVYAKSSAGNATVQADEAIDLKVSCSSGRAKATVLRLTGNAELSSSAGEVELEADSIDGDVIAKSSIGGVFVMLPKDISLKIRTDARMGKIICQIPNNPDAKSALTATSSLGNVTIKAKESRN